MFLFSFLCKAKGVFLNMQLQRFRISTWPFCTNESLIVHELFVRLRGEFLKCRCSESILSASRSCSGCVKRGDPRREHTVAINLYLSSYYGLASFPTSDSKLHLGKNNQEKICSEKKTSFSVLSIYFLSANFLKSF